MATDFDAGNDSGGSLNVTRADELGVGDETLDPVSGCTCVVTAVRREDFDVVLDMRGAEGKFTLTVAGNREMALRKKNDPFEC